MNIGALRFALLLALLNLACETQADRDKMKAEAFAQGEAKAKADAAAKSDATAKALRDDRERQEKEKADRLARDRAVLLANPTALLDASALQFFDKGIINHYRQLTGVTVFNRSKFPVADLEGMTDWLDASGAILGSTPVNLVGSIGPGESRTFSARDQTLRSGTLQAKTSQARIRITHVTLPAQ